VGSFQAEDFKTHNHSTNSAGAHTHTWSDQWSSSEGGDGTISVMLDDQDMGTNSWTTSSDGSHTHTITNTGGNETRPDNVAVYYIIKY
jgi:hypothetical protein